jgi:glycine cleavage system H protein
MEVSLLLNAKGLRFPLDRKYYTKNGAHLWLKQEGNLVKIGMDAFAAEMLGSLTFLSVTKKHVKSEEAIGILESSKFVSKFYSPISGKIIAVNDQVLSNPRKINDSPYDSWVLAMKPDNKVYESKYIIEESDEILRWISKEIKRLKSD